jgi:pimeloyl-ACP methyl ester carboxylesterase
VWQVSCAESCSDGSGPAEVYTELLDDLNLSNVTVVGNSIGGWIAAEMGVLGSTRIRGSALVDAAGIEVVDHPTRYRPTGGD